MRKHINLIKLSAIIVVFLVIITLPCNDEFTPEIKYYTAVTVFGIGCMALSIFSSPLIPSLVLLFGYFSCSDSGTIMQGWTTDAVWITMCVLMILKTTERTGLLYRFVYKCLSKVGGSYTGICVGLFFIGFILSFLDGSTVIVLIAVAAGVVGALDLSHTKQGVGIMMSAFVGVQDANSFVMPASTAGWYYDMAKAGSELVNTNNINHISWFSHGAVFVLSYISFLVIIILLCRPKQKSIDVFNSRDFFDRKLRGLNPMSSDEKKLAVIIFALFAYLFSAPLHGQSLMYGYVAAVIFLFLPCINVGCPEDIQKTNFPFVIFMVACLAIGNVATKVGATDLIVKVISPVFKNSNVTVFLITVFLTSYILNFFMTPLAIYASFLSPLAGIFMNLSGVHDVAPLLLVIFIGTGNVLLPYETTNNMILYSFDTMTMREHIKMFGIRSIVALIAILLAIPYWKLLGLWG